MERWGPHGNHQPGNSISRKCFFLFPSSGMNERSAPERITSIIGSSPLPCPIVSLVSSRLILPPCWLLSCRNLIEPDHCTYNFTPARIDICLKKRQSQRWGGLEAPAARGLHLGLSELPLWLGFLGLGSEGDCGIPEMPRRRKSQREQGEQ